MADAGQAQQLRVREDRLKGSTAERCAVGPVGPGVHHPGDVERAFDRQISGDEVEYPQAFATGVVACGAARGGGEPDVTGNQELVARIHRPAARGHRVQTTEPAAQPYSVRDDPDAHQDRQPPQHRPASPPDRAKPS